MQSMWELCDGGVGEEFCDGWNLRMDRGRSLAKFPDLCGSEGRKKSGARDVSK